MTWRKLLALVLGIFGCVACGQIFGQSNAEQKSPAITKSDASSYEEWIERYKTQPLTHLSLQTEPILIEVTQISGDDLPDEVGPNQLLGSNVSYDATTISATGVLWTYRGSSGGGGGHLPRKDFETLKSLMIALPDDHRRLPPAGHRLVVQVAAKNGNIARVYDRASLPEGVLGILRLLGPTRMRPLTFDFRAEKTEKDVVKAGVKEVAGVPLSEFPSTMFGNPVVANSPDKTMMVREEPGQWSIDPPVHFQDLRKECNPKGYSVSGLEKTVVRISDRKSGALIHELNEPNIGRCWVIAYRAWVTPDNHYLLLLNSLPGMRVYDTATWERVDHLPGLPAGAVAYHPSSDWKHGVSVSESGEIDLWDATTEKVLAKIGSDEELQSVSFSPDNSLVAVVNLRKNDTAWRAHLRIWNTTTGQFVAEPLPFEQRSNAIHEPVWVDGGRYLMASTQDTSFFDVPVFGIWSAETWKYRGTFYDCNQPNRQLVFKDQQMISQCGNDAVTWNFVDAIQTIKSFEAALLSHR